MAFAEGVLALYRERSELDDILDDVKERISTFVCFDFVKAKMAANI